MEESSSWLRKVHQPGEKWTVLLTAFQQVELFNGFDFDFELRRHYLGKLFLIVMIRCDIVWEILLDHSVSKSCWMVSVEPPVAVHPASSSISNLFHNWQYKRKFVMAILFLQIDRRSSVVPGCLVMDLVMHRGALHIIITLHIFILCSLTNCRFWLVL